MTIVIDAQVHVWAADSPEHPWPVEHGQPQRAEPLGPEELLDRMDDAGVDRAILVPPTWQGDTNWYSLEAARRWPDRFAVMGRFDIAAPPRPDVIASWRGAGMLGLRLTLHTESSRRAAHEGDLDWIWAAAQQHGVPVALYVPGDLPYVDRLAQRFPDLSILLCHAGLPIEARDAQIWPALDSLRPLADRPNVAVKASALPFYTTESWPYGTVQKVLRQIVDDFGPDRTFWGSDLSRLTCPYPEAVALYRDSDVLTAREKDLVLGRGVAAWLGWDIEDEKAGASA